MKSNRLAQIVAAAGLVAIATVGVASAAASAQETAPAGPTSTSTPAVSDHKAHDILAGHMRGGRS